jgi:hypothetical protein
VQYAGFPGDIEYADTNFDRSLVRTCFVPDRNRHDNLSTTMSAPPPQRIINYGGGWKDGQVNEPCILVNPKDPTKLIMFFSGMQLGGSQGRDRQGLGQYR